MYKIAPSLLEADFKYLQKDIKALEDAGIEYIHLDIMDGNFVPNLSFGLAMIRSIRSATNLIFDIHLMIDEPIRFVDRFREAGADVISVHYEACTDIEETLDRIRKSGAKAGIVLNPETSIDVLADDLLRKVDVVQLMTVMPGIPGQSFFPDSLERIRGVRKKLDELGMDKDIEVDGDIKAENVRAVVEAGATVIVSGKGIFQNSIPDNVSMFRKSLQGL